MTNARRTAVIAGLGVGSIALATLLVALLAGDGGDASSSSTRFSVHFGGLGYGGFGFPIVRKTSVHVLRNDRYQANLRALQTLRRTAFVSLGGRTADPGVDLADLDRALSGVRASAERCYQGMLGVADVEAAIEIAADGSSTIVHLDGGTDPAQQCLRTALDGVVFAAPSGGTAATFRQHFIFDVY